MATPVADLFEQLFSVTAWSESYVAGETVAQLLPALRDLENKVNGTPVTPAPAPAPVFTPPAGGSSV